MKKNELKDVMERMLEFSKVLLLRDGYIASVGFIHYGDKMDIVPIKFKNQEDKEIQIQALGKVARMKKADAIFIISESWYVTSDKKDLIKDLSIVPSKHPARKEAIFVFGECEEGDITIMQKFERKKRENGEKDEFIFGEKEDIGIGFSKFEFGIKKN